MVCGRATEREMLLSLVFYVLVLRPKSEYQGDSFAQGNFALNSLVVLCGVPRPRPFRCSAR